MQSQATYSYPGSKKSVVKPTGRKGESSFLLWPGTPAISGSADYSSDAICKYISKHSRIYGGSIPSTAFRDGPEVTLISHRKEKVIIARITKAEATLIERAGSDPLHGEEMRVRLTFTDEILGTASAKKDLHETYIASKAPDAKTREQEIAAIGVEEAIRNAMTIFPRNEKGEPMLWPYQVRGFFKSAQGMMNMCVEKSDRKTSKAYMPSYKSKIDNLIFVKACDAETYGDHRGIVIHVPEDKAMDTCERPLRAETMQGPRVSLANSESCPAGSYIEFDIMARGKLIGRVMDWLDFGRYNGLGQWRNSGKGAFEWEVLD